MILGNGLSAKIFAFYNREYKIIGKDITMSKDSILSKMIFLQDNPYNRMFLKDIIFISKKPISMVYKNISVVSLGNEEYKIGIEKDERKEILKKKLTDGERSLSFKDKVFKENSKLSESSYGVLKTIEIDFAEIIEILDSIIEPQIIDRTFIKEIDLDKKIIKTEIKDYEYSSCISTINLNIFYKLCGITDKKYETLDTTIVKGTEEEFKIPFIPYDDAIVYFPQKEFEFGKIIKRDKICYAEITGKAKSSEGVFKKDTRLIKENITNDFEDFLFLGRYAEWDPDVKIQDVVKKSSDRNVMQKIWSNQKSFSSLFYDLKEDSDTIQENVKDQSMLLIGEVFSLLENINWKKHAIEKKLELEKIEEELIDIFKYWLTISINLGINFEDFVDAYYKKSRRLRELKGGKKNDN